MFLFVIHVCVVLVFWKWKNDLIPYCISIFGILEMEKHFLCYSCLRCIGILAMEKQNHFPVCIFIIGILVREGCSGHSCMHFHLAYRQ
jgi:hypothetical protein